MHRSLLAGSWNCETISRCFDRQAESTPDSIAIQLGSDCMTYRELDQAANRLAHLLADHGAGPGQCVALLFSRSAEAIVAVLAVLKTGAAYLPIDPIVPTARMQFMVADATPVAVLTTADLTGRFDESPRLSRIDRRRSEVACWPMLADSITYLSLRCGRERRRVTAGEVRRVCCGCPR